MRNPLREASVELKEQLTEMQIVVQDIMMDRMMDREEKIELAKYRFKQVGEAQAKFVNELNKLV